MISLEEAKEQLLSQIELELCRIYPTGSMAPKKLKEFYEHIAELPLSNPISAWYRLNADKVRIKCDGDEVRIYKSDVEAEIPHSYSTGEYHSDALDELIDQAFENKN